jgi:glycerol-3-phosphate dehydrogenase
MSVKDVDGQVIRLKDEISGEEYKISPLLVINAAGPWIDRVNSGLGLAGRYIGPTKGSHLVLDHPELRAAIGENELFFENKDGRIVLIFPLLDKVMIGTSDLPVENPDEVQCTEEEIVYFFDMIKRVFPTIEVKREHVIFHFSGVRPLEYSNAKTTGQISRDHSIKVDTLGTTPVYSLVGGKWTSYRAFSEQITDKALAFLGKTRQASTLELPIGGGRDYADVLRQPEKDPLLFERYGSRWSEVAAYLGEDRSPLLNYPAMYRREVAFLVEKEMVVRLDDLVLRRSLMAYLGHVTRPLIDELADVAAGILGWSQTHKQAEIDRTVDLLRDQHGARL